MSQTIKQRKIHKGKDFQNLAVAWEKTVSRDIFVVWEFRIGQIEAIKKLLHINLIQFVANCKF